MINKNRQACYAVMGMKDKRLTPQARYFLIRLLFLYGSSLVEMQSFKQDRRLGVSDSIIRKSIILLKLHGYLEHASKPMQMPIKRGRTREVFRVKSNWWNVWSSASQVSLSGQMFFSHLIDGWLFDIGRADEQQKLALKQATIDIKKDKLDPVKKKTFTLAMTQSKKNKLSPANRILLATLYLHADEFGVVKELGSTGLLWLTGMDRDCLKRHFDTIKKNGYLLVRVAGLTGAHSFGLVKSLFYMNPLSKLVEGKYNSTLVMSDIFSSASNSIQMLSSNIYLNNINSPANFNANQNHSLIDIRKLLLDDDLLYSFYYPFRKDSDQPDNLPKTSKFAFIINSQPPNPFKWMNYFKGHGLEIFFKNTVTYNLISICNTKSVNTLLFLLPNYGVM